ncbi:hypothetical protein Salat_1862300 [Sesamum alatum]|uniref:Uncharacterized protein n=1 Tax=Sesamum alatum TaxID=300844 RepID=A0AAE1Y305_9LAMI|nr:hypothetical protein Salat_1862300 [Sesamum alatum]
MGSLPNIRVALRCLISRQTSTAAFGHHSGEDLVGEEDDSPPLPAPMQTPRDTFRGKEVDEVRTYLDPSTPRLGGQILMGRKGCNGPRIMFRVKERDPNDERTGQKVFPHAANHFQRGHGRGPSGGYRGYRFEIRLSQKTALCQVDHQVNQRIAGFDGKLTGSRAKGAFLPNQGAGYSEGCIKTRRDQRTTCT